MVRQVGARVPVVIVVPASYSVPPRPPVFETSPWLRHGRRGPGVLTTAQRDTRDPGGGEASEIAYVICL